MGASVAGFGGRLSEFDEVQAARKITAEQSIAPEMDGSNSFISGLFCVGNGS